MPSSRFEVIPIVLQWVTAIQPKTLWEPISMKEFLKVLKESRKLKCHVCGKPTMLRYPSQVKDGRGKYCSKECFHLGSKGQQRSPGTQFPKGNIPYFAGTKGIAKPNSGSFKKGDFSRRGENHPSWKGGISKLAFRIRKCWKYIEWRSSVYKKDNYTCQFCGARETRLEADHIKAFSLILSEHSIKTMEEAFACNELWDINNGRTLCTSCHKKTENYGNRKLKVA